MDDANEDASLLVGYIAVERESGNYLSSEDGACVTFGEPGALESFIRSASVETSEERDIEEVSYDDVVDNLFEGIPFAFDTVAYERFRGAAIDEGLDAPEFAELAVEIEGTGISLAVVELEDEEGDDDEDDDEDSGEEE